MCQTVLKFKKISQISDYSIQIWQHCTSNVELKVLGLKWIGRFKALFYLVLKIWHAISHVDIKCTKLQLGSTRALSLDGTEKYDPFGVVFCIVSIFKKCGKVNKSLWRWAHVVSLRCGMEKNMKLSLTLNKFFFLCFYYSLLLFCFPR